MKITGPAHTLALDPIPTVIYHVKVTAQVSVPPTEGALVLEHKLYISSGESLVIKKAQVTQIEELEED